MKILITGLSMSYLSGQPLYCFETCRELKRMGHEVVMMSEWNGALRGNDGHRLREELEKDGVKCVGWNYEIRDYDFDLCIASETASNQAIRRIPNTPVINVVHSEYDCETPLENTDQIIKYVCVRPSVKEHIINYHNIPKDKCVVIYNGVDRERFRPRKKLKRDYYKIVVPCTLDTLRERFLNKLIDEATEKKRVFIYGFDCGAKLHKNKWAEIHPDRFDIEYEIADADEVAGILFGRVNIEAWSCNVDSSIYDPITLEYRKFSPPIDFDLKHNIKNVVGDILALLPNLEDLTIIIPHHDQIAKLKDLLEDIRGIKKIIVPKGGTFAENCNTGFKATNTPYVLFLNDDTRIPTINIFRNMIKMIINGYDIVGCYMSNGYNGGYIQDGYLIDANTTKQEPHYPSGSCLMIKSEVFKKLGGFDEVYKNGCEDMDLYLRAEKMGYKIGIAKETIIHEHEGSSTGRYDHLKENIKIFNDRWSGKCYIR